LKTKAEIVVAHDKINCTLRGELGPVPKNEKRLLTMMRDTLCWALDHSSDGAKQASYNLRMIDERAADRGKVLGEK